MNADLGLGLMLTQTPHSIADVIVVHGLDVTEPCSGIALKKEEIADTVQTGLTVSVLAKVVIFTTNADTKN